MYLEPYPNRAREDGMKVWLEQPELDRFIDTAKNTEQRIAFNLLGYSGLRSAETLAVTPRDVVLTGAGPRVRVVDGKGGKDRETIASDELVTLAETIADVGGRDPDDALIETDNTRTLRRWVSIAAERLQDETDDEGWQWLSPHDLRGTWATLMAHDYDVDVALVCDWGGWEKIETFRSHYRGTYSTTVQQRELERVPWIDAGDADAHP